MDEAERKRTGPGGRRRNSGDSLLIPIESNRIGSAAGEKRAVREIAHIFSLPAPESLRIRVLSLLCSLSTVRGLTP